MCWVDGGACVVLGLGVAASLVCTARVMGAHGCSTTALDFKLGTSCARGS